MYFIPLPVFEASPNITVGYCIRKSMISSALGNVIGGGRFVGDMYWYYGLIFSFLSIVFS